MFILIGYVSLALVQLYRRYQRRKFYSGTMMRALRSGSVLVQRGRSIQNRRTNALFSSSLLTCSQSYKETQLLTDERLGVSLVSPKQQVDLGEWTSYLDLHPAQDISGGVVALLEAGRLDSSETAVSADCTVSPEVQVHVLKHGCPLAWKSGSPFGIILHCSYSDFVLLCDAFEQGHLVLDDDLQLCRMLTISTVGKPKTLRRPRSEEIVSYTEKENPVKSKRSNTDPPGLLTSTHTHSPLYVSVENNITMPEMAQKESIKSEILSSAKPEKEVTSGHEEKFYTEYSVVRMVENQPCMEKVVCDKVSAYEKSELTNGASHKSHDGETPEVIEMKNKSAVIEKGDRLEPSPQLNKNAEDWKQGVQSSSQEHLHSATESSSTSIIHSGRNLETVRESKTDLSGSQEAAVKRDADSTGSQQSLNAPQKDKPVSSLSQQDLQKDSKTLPQQGVKTASEHCAVSNGSKQNSPPPGKDKRIVNGSPQDMKTPFEMTKVKKVDAEPNLVTSASKPTRSGDKDTKSGANSAEPAQKSANGVGSGNGGERSGKPPNILVYCGLKDSARKYNMIKAGLEQCLNPDAYTVYSLAHDDIMTIPWDDNTAALIISHDYLHDNIGKKCADFLLKGGKVISFGSSMEAEFVVRKEVKGRPEVAKFSVEKWRDVSAIQGRYQYMPGSLKKANSSMDTLVVDSKSGQPIVVQLMLSPDNGSGRAIFSQLFLEREPSEMAANSKTFSRLKQNSKERLEVLRHLLSLLDLDTSTAASHSLTPCYLLAQDQAQKKSFLDSITGRMRQGCIRSRCLSLKFVTTKSGSSALTATNNTLPVVTDIHTESLKGDGDAPHFQYFDPKVYWHHLTSSVLGHVVLYTEIIPTTMTVFEGIQFSIPKDLGLVAVAGRQTSGKGRGDNTWLSPIGCAMFTLPLSLPVDSYLGQHISFLQHVVSLSVVHSIRSLPGYEDLDLCLKWPNDIYYGKHTKLGGVLVNSTIMGKTVHATVGCGVNVSNSQPTMCINAIIQQHNRERGSNLKPLTTSEMLARTVSTLESVLARFQDKGHEDFCHLYYKYWLHSGACVKVESEGNMEVEICGLDDFGFLRVVNQQGQHLSVQPDGNSFDMLRNLITIKRD